MHLYELMDLQIAIHEFMRQMYMLEFNLEDEEMIGELKTKEQEMELILAQVSSLIKSMSKPTTNNRNVTVPSICRLDY